MDGISILDLRYAMTFWTVWNADYRGSSIPYRVSTVCGSRRPGTSGQRTKDYNEPFKKSSGKRRLV